ncbi:hypothetical protein DB30_04729 [Enhygromyxa salina]|uniref:Uncharacterized protein n=2 Tax=Enhygromyxa salina TaxID=215803 RepID=A0A0C1ZF59_9BACT|nr:hypothetical protein DB30_04729 [Enhygromyxa salina]
MVYVFGASLLGPVVIPVLPIFFLGGLSIITETYRWAHADIACDECRKLIVMDGELLVPVGSVPAQVIVHEPSHGIAA